MIQINKNLQKKKKKCLNLSAIPKLKLVDKSKGKNIQQNEVKIVLYPHNNTRISKLTACLIFQLS